MSTPVVPVTSLVTLEGVPVVVGSLGVGSSGGRVPVVKLMAPADGCGKVAEGSEGFC